MLPVLTSVKLHLPFILTAPLGVEVVESHEQVPHICHRHLYQAIHHVLINWNKHMTHVLITSSQGDGRALQQETNEVMYLTVLCVRAGWGGVGVILHNICERRIK